MKAIKESDRGCREAAQHVHEVRDGGADAVIATNMCPTLSPTPVATAFTRHYPLTEELRPSSPYPKLRMRLVVCWLVRQLIESIISMGGSRC